MAHPRPGPFQPQSRTVDEAQVDALDLSSNYSDEFDDFGGFVDLPDEIEDFAPAQPSTRTQTATYGNNNSHLSSQLNAPPPASYPPAPVLPSPPAPPTSGGGPALRKCPPGCTPEDGYFDRRGFWNFYEEAQNQHPPPPPTLAGAGPSSSARTPFVPKQQQQQPLVQPRPTPPAQARQGQENAPPIARQVGPGFFPSRAPTSTTAAPGLGPPPPPQARIAAHAPPTQKKFTIVDETQNPIRPTQPRPPTRKSPFIGSSRPARPPAPTPPQPSPPRVDPEPVVTRTPAGAAQRSASRPAQTVSSVGKAQTPPRARPAHAGAKFEESVDVEAIIDELEAEEPKPAPPPPHQHKPERPLVSVSKGQKLSTQILPDMHRSFFDPVFDEFTEMQSQVFNATYHSGENLVISAPTGSGKTVIFELAILAALNDVNSKVVYMAPTRSLCSERATDWKGRFSRFDIDVVEFTGESTTGDARQAKGKWKEVQKARVVVTTPEKWDNVSRTPTHDRTLGKVKLFLLDEIHSVGVDGRGAVMEVVVSRMKRKVDNPRFLAVSATVPNVECVAEWIGARGDPTHPAHFFIFGDEHRPVKLDKIVVGLPKFGNEFQWLMSANKQLFQIIAAHADGKPVLVFCNSRKGCIQAAEQIKKDYGAAAEKATHNLPWNKPAKIGYAFQDNKLAELAEHGLAFHNAGLGFTDRQWVEQQFVDAKNNGAIKVVCCTSTLAVGVNLPARMVIVRGTSQWQSGRSVPYSDLEIMQMMGRAGRRQYDDKGVGVILCEEDKKQHFVDLVNARTVLESSLHKNLVEHINSEIGLATITDLNSALDWLRNTFLWVRIHKNPDHYAAIAKDTALAPAGTNSPETSLESFVVKALEELVASDVVEEKVRGTEHNYSSTPYGNIMARNGLSLPTFQSILELPRNASMRTLLTALSRAKEFVDLRWRANEKTAYARANKKLQFPAEFQQPGSKCLFLVQTVLEGVSLTDARVDNANPNSEIFQLWPSALRVAKAMVEVALERKDGGVKTCLDLLRSLNGKAWSGSSGVLRQVKWIGEKGSKSLHDVGICSLAALAAQSESRLALVTSLPHNKAREAYNDAKSFPRFGISGRIAKEINIDAGVKILAEVEVQLVNGKTLRHGKNNRWTVSVLTITSDGNYIDFRKRNLVDLLDETIAWELSVTLTKPSQRVKATVACDEVAGTEATLELKPTSVAEAYPILAEHDVFDDELEWNADGERELQAFEKLQRPPKRTQPQPAPPAPARASPALRSPVQPTQRPDGRWFCNHHCANRVACKHDCCKNGLDKPPKSSKAKQPLAVSPPSPVPVARAAPVRVSTAGPSQRAVTMDLDDSDSSLPSVNEMLAPAAIKLAQARAKGKASKAKTSRRSTKVLPSLISQLSGRNDYNELVDIVRKTPAYIYALPREYQNAMFQSGVLSTWPARVKIEPDQPQADSDRDSHSEEEEEDELDSDEALVRRSPSPVVGPSGFNFGGANLGESSSSAPAKRDRNALDLSSPFGAGLEDNTSRRPAAKAPKLDSTAREEQPLDLGEISATPHSSGPRVPVAAVEEATEDQKTEEKDPNVEDWSWMPIMTADEETTHLELTRRRAQAEEVHLRSRTAESEQAKPEKGKATAVEIEPVEGVAGGSPAIGTAEQPAKGEGGAPAEGEEDDEFSMENWLKTGVEWI